MPTAEGEREDQPDIVQVFGSGGGGERGAGAGGSGSGSGERRGRYRRHPREERKKKLLSLAEVIAILHPQEQEEKGGGDPFSSFLPWLQAFTFSLEKREEEGRRKGKRGSPFHYVNGAHPPLSPFFLFFVCKCHRRWKGGRRKTLAEEEKKEERRADAATRQTFPTFLPLFFLSFHRILFLFAFRATEEKTFAPLPFSTPTFPPSTVYPRKYHGI